MICPNMKRGKVKPKAATTTTNKMDEDEEEGDDYRELYDEIREELFTIVSDLYLFIICLLKRGNRTHMYPERNSRWDAPVCTARGSCH